LNQTLFDIAQLLQILGNKKHQGEQYSLSVYHPSLQRVYIEEADVRKPTFTCTI